MLVYLVGIGTFLILLQEVNFLGTPALEACTLIESLVGVPPINVVKTEITLEEVLEKLSFRKKFAKYP
jgi:hypothetical protein